MNNGDSFMRKIDYPTLLLFHIDRILKSINENGATATVETSIDALWATITDELKKDKVEKWEEIDSREIPRGTEAERMYYGKQKVLDKLQLIMNILGENGFLYRSSYEELIGDEVSVDED